MACKEKSQKTSEFRPLASCAEYLAGLFPFTAALNGILTTPVVFVRNKLPGSGRMVWRFFFLILMSCISRASSMF